MKKSMNLFSDTCEIKEENYTKEMRNRSENGFLIVMGLKGGWAVQIVIIAIINHILLKPNDMNQRSAN